MSAEEQHTADSASSGHEDAPDTTSFAYRLQWLYDHQADPRSINDATPRFFNDSTLARRLEELGAEVSSTTLWNLRRGIHPHPKFNLVQVIAKAFGRTTMFFSEDYTIEQAENEMRLLQVLRNEGIRMMALRASTWSPELLQTMLDMFEHFDAMHQLPSPVIPPHPRPRQRRKK